MDQNPQEIDPRITFWRSVIQGEQKSWVLFEHGTLLILMKPGEDLATQAREIMSEWGPVQVGTSAGDFTTHTHPDDPYGGWFVTGHHPDMLNYITPQEVDDPNASTMTIGLLGRENRDKDAHALKIVHIEDKRSRQ